MWRAPFRLIVFGKNNWKCEKLFFLNLQIFNFKLNACTNEQRWKISRKKYFTIAFWDYKYLNVFSSFILEGSFEGNR